MKFSPTTVTVITAAFIPLAGLLAQSRRGFLRAFAIYLGALAVIDLALLWTGIAGWLYWWIHCPSAFALGVDEILERHGTLVSSAAHAGDLVLWSILLALLTYLKSHRKNRRYRDTQTDPHVGRMRT